MTPYDKLQAAAEEYGLQIHANFSPTQMQLYWHGLLYGLTTNVEVVEAMAEALRNFYRDVSKSRDETSGKPTGEAHADSMLYDLLNVCGVCEVAPPRNLVAALAYRFNLFDRGRPRDQIDGEKLRRLAHYYQRNPTASQRQAAIETGLSRETVRKYMALPEWTRLLAPPKKRIALKMTSDAAQVVRRSSKKT